MLDILFQYGPFTLRTYNVFLAFAFLISMVFLLRYVNRKKLPAAFLSDYFILFLLAGFLGGRLMEVVEKWSDYAEHPLSVLFVWDLNLSPFGIAIGVLTNLWFVTRGNREQFWTWLDAFTLTGLVGLIFVHFGRFFNGTDYGTPTDLPWGIAFDSLSIPFLNPIHPVQIYSALIAFLVFGYAMKKSRRNLQNGIVGTLGIMLYCVSAFLMEFLQGAPSLYDKISFATLGAAAFILLVMRSHTHNIKTANP